MADSSNDSASTSVTLNLITFNLGMNQQMLQGGPWQTRHSDRFRELMNIWGNDYNADFSVARLVDTKQG